MKSHIKTIYNRLLKSTRYPTHRYLFEKFSLNNRLTGIIGARGTGKTTLMLQYIKEHIDDKSTCIYASLDNIYFTNINLFDFVEDMYELEEIKIFFFDEIHKYKNWNQELKNIYDSFPDIKVIFSGSSTLDLVNGTYDLSRRGITYHLYGLSFREFLNFKLKLELPKLTFEEIITQKGKNVANITETESIRRHFKEYLKSGYYPFYFEDMDNYLERISNVIDKTIYEDIANFHNLKTGNLILFKKLLAFFATIPPGETSINSISKNLGVDNKTVTHYLEIMESTGLLTSIKINKSGSSLLKTPEKVYVDNFNLYSFLSKSLGLEAKVGTIREIFFIKMLQNSGYKLFYSKIWDFEIDNKNFEIGGKNKTRKQIKNNLENSYLVKDDIIYGEKDVIPLYLFGFLY